MNYDPKDTDEDDDYPYYREEDEMDTKYPDYSEESKNAGRFLGLDFPYVPGDPGL